MEKLPYSWKGEKGRTVVIMEMSPLVPFKNQIQPFCRQMWQKDTRWVVLSAANTQGAL